MQREVKHFVKLPPSAPDRSMVTDILWQDSFPPRQMFHFKYRPLNLLDPIAIKNYECFYLSAMRYGITFYMYLNIQTGI